MTQFTRPNSAAQRQAFDQGQYAFLRVRVWGPGQKWSDKVDAVGVQTVDRLGRVTDPQLLFVHESDLISPEDARKAVQR